MVEWMRAHNADPGSALRVSFTGFDMQDPARAMDMVEAYLSKVDPAAGKRNSPYSCYRTQQGDLLHYARQPAEAKADCRRNLQAAYDNLVANRALYEAKSSPREFAEALHAARIVLQSQEMFAASDYYDGPDPRRGNGRKRGLAAGAGGAGFQGRTLGA